MKKLVSLRLEEEDIREAKYIAGTDVLSDAIRILIRRSAERVEVVTPVRGEVIPENFFVKDPDYTGHPPSTI